jgi:hypothetical protein
MLHRDINSVPYLALAASAAQPTVTYIILTWRMNELGGERHCRQWLKKLQQDGLVTLESDCRTDKREKLVRVSSKGYQALNDVYGMLGSIRRCIEPTSLGNGETKPVATVQTSV